MTFSEGLKNLIKISDTMLKQVAVTVGYEDSYISKWYNDKNIPSKKTLIK